MKLTKVYQITFKMDDDGNMYMDASGNNEALKKNDNIIKNIIFDLEEFKYHVFSELRSMKVKSMKQEAISEDDVEDQMIG